MIPSSKRFAECQPVLDDVLRKCQRNQWRVQIFFLCLGAFSFVGGVIMYAAPGDETEFPGILTTTLGFMIMVASCTWMLLRRPEDVFAEFRSTLEHRPEELVWSYILEQRVNGFPSWFVVMNFRNKKIIYVPNKNIPNKDMEEFIALLSRLNPRMHVGFSEDLKKMYKRGEM